VNLPRWTVYPALAVLFAGVLAFIPRDKQQAPQDAAARELFELEDPRAGAQAGEEFRRVVVLGIDGLDPHVLRETCERFPELTPNFRWLIERSGLHQLGTSTPPQSPVAWSNFITGLDPGGHGIFDFVHRDPVTRLPASSTTRDEPPSLIARAVAAIPVPGSYALPSLAGSGTNRTGAAFWTLLKEAGVPADIWRMPVNFPVEPASGLSFPGMMTPALDSAYGVCTLYTTDPARLTGLDFDKIELVRLEAGRIDTRLLGPPNEYKDGSPQTSVALSLHVDAAAGALAIEGGDRPLILRPGQWSDFARFTFDKLPVGIGSASGIARFYLRSLAPHVELYASPVNIDPLAPVVPVSAPAGASAEVAERIGLYYTQGMAEDVNALKQRVLGDEEFAAQTSLVHGESGRMFDVALERYLARGAGGLLFFYYSSVDLASHMLWRHRDAQHPAHDPAFAARDSSVWSSRAGSTWREAVLDLVLRMDPVLGELRRRLGDDTTLIVMSDHGFASYRRSFNINTWLLENGYLVLKEGRAKELEPDSKDFREVYLSDGCVDWSRTRAYGAGFQGVYLNLRGRERDDPSTPEDESGCVVPGEPARALALEIKRALEALRDEDGSAPIHSCALATEVYNGPRVAEAPDLIVGYNSGYGNSDAATLGRLTHRILEDNLGGSFNGSHLMAAAVVPGTLLSNRSVRAGDHRLEDLTVELLRQYGLPPADGMRGHAVLE
jgi:predicted AlkP superfamily phosphohydrolase/phosphomutase